MRKLVLTCLACSALLVPASASAVMVIDFTGTRTNIDAPGPAAARCGSLATINIRNSPPTATSTGTSNLGAFTATMSHCIGLPPSLSAPTPYTLGEFVFDFGAGNTIFGDYSGFLTPVSAGVFSITQTHLINGGTGQYAGASGTLSNLGTLTFGQGAPRATHTITGRIFAPIPEPGTWMMMLFGFAAVGTLLRRRQRQLLPAVA